MSNQETPLRFGIIGIGNIAPFHALAAKAVPGGQLVAVATRTETKARKFQAEYGAQAYYTDYRRLLERPDIDVVTICTPHFLHEPMTLEAAAAGKHVLVEKPMAITVEEADRMIAACQKAGVKLGVVFQSRFDPLARKLKKALDEGRLGKPLLASMTMKWYRTDEYYLSGEWRGTWAQEGGGALINQAIHGIDLLRWMAGPVKAINGCIATLAHDIEVEDVAFAVLEYESGAMGMIEGTTVAYPGFAERLEFSGTEGSVIYDKGNGKLHWYLKELVEERVDEIKTSSGAARPMDISAEGHVKVFRDFAEAIREDRKPLVDGHEGRHSLEIIQAIYRSARERRTIELPL